MTRKTVTAIVFSVAISMVHAGCSDSRPAEASAAPKPAVSAPAPPDHEPFFLASGPLIVEHQVDVAAQRDGLITEILAEPDLPVQKGQLLAKMDDRQLTADLDAARARTRAAADDLKNWEAEAKVLDADAERARKMWDAELITREQYDHARYKAESDQWDVKRASEVLVNAQQTEHSLELELEKTHICAPFSGVVARRYVRAGQEVTKGDRLFWVTETAPLRVKFTLPEHFAGKIQRGEVFDLTSADTGDTTYKAKVIEISPVIDPASGTIEVLAQLGGATQDLRPGMTASIRVPNQP